MGSQGYGVNGALCPFRQSLCWAKETGDKEECQPASTSRRPCPGLFQTVVELGPGLWKAGSIPPSWFPSGSLSGLKQPLRSENKEEVAEVPAAAHAGLLKQLLLVQP